MLYLGLHIRTRPYTPKTNGKAERFIQTARREQAYAQAYPTSDRRAEELPIRLHRCNWHRHHRQPSRAVALQLMRLWESCRSAVDRREVCILVANGTSVDNIASQLGISEHTAVAHGRWIYNRLDVHNRTELANKLLSIGSV